MAIHELKEAIQLLQRVPALWISGLVNGILLACIWLLYNVAGAFFTSRLIVIFGLICVFFVTGSIALIKTGSGGIMEILSGGTKYFFRVLLPFLVVIFILALLVIIATITFTLGGAAPDTSDISFLLLAFGIPAAILALFLDSAAVFEDRKIFDSIRRSIELVTTKFGNVLAFIVSMFAITAGVSFLFMVVWEAALYDKLEPITHYTETQMQAFTMDQLVTLIGPSGVAITAVILFCIALVLIPLLTTYKACYFRSISAGAPSIQQQTTGEFDSKGRWYKY